MFARFGYIGMVFATGALFLGLLVWTVVAVLPPTTDALTGNAVALHGGAKALTEDPLLFAIFIFAIPGLLFYMSVSAAQVRGYM